MARKRNWFSKWRQIERSPHPSTTHPSPNFLRRHQHCAEGRLLELTREMGAHICALARVLLAHILGSASEALARLTVDSYAEPHTENNGLGHRDLAILIAQ